MLVVENVDMKRNIVVQATYPSPTEEGRHNGEISSHHSDNH